MISSLPEPVKQQVLEYLKRGNFVVAKAIHDDYLAKNPQKNLEQNNKEINH